MTVTADSTTASALGWPDVAVPAPGGTPPATPTTRTAWWWPAVAAVLAAAALVAGTVAVTQHSRAGDRAARAADEQAAVAAARAVASSLDTYDYKDLDASFDAVIGASTDPFKSQYSSTSAQLKDLLVHYKASATSTILAAGVAGHTASSVTVLLFVDQTVTNAGTAQPRLAHNRLQLVLRKDHGRWLVAQAQLL